MVSFPVIFDGHNDVVHTLRDGSYSFFERHEVDVEAAPDRESGHLDLPRAREAGLGGGIFALYVSPRPEDHPDGPPPDLPHDIDPAESIRHWPSILPQEYALAETVDLFGVLFHLERESEGRCKIVRTAAELQSCLDDGTFAMVVHIEGAEALDPGGRALEVLQAAGLRSVGLAHERRNHYCDGAPWIGIGDPDVGPGLSDAGKELVHQLNRKKVVIDLAHLNGKGFWDVAAISDAPLVSSHANAWTLTNAPRNLTDRQLDAVRESRGVVGLNFTPRYLTADVSHDLKVTISRMVDHVEYMVERMGIDHVGLGSDFDGTSISVEVGDVSGLPRLLEAIRERGYDGDDLVKLAHGNWVRVFRETWGA